ncbi:hypothetical protein B0H19DRAFT_1380553 [Mycena capillaripes]|nr:hypothetical protein B0H19DRAFT_1380553 [Mycena capillaripes]
MPDTPKGRRYSLPSLPSVAEGINSDWRQYSRPDGSKYYAKTTEQNDSAKHCDLVVDELSLMKPVNEINSSNFFCEEVYFLSKDNRLFVFHSSQTALYSSQQPADVKIKRKLYWQYIAAHPAHAERSMAKWLPEAHKLALVFLKWCSFEALTSSTAKIPFSLKHSQDLTNILVSLYEQTEMDSPPPERDTLMVTSQGHEGPGFVEPERFPDNAAASEEAHPVEAEAGGSSQPIDRPESPNSEEEEREPLELVVHDQVLPVPATETETASQESCKLRTALIAKVLTEKYSQQGAVDNSSETDQLLKPSQALNVLFWIVDVASLGSFLRYLNRLEEVRATILTDDQWRDHILRLVKEWEEFNLISTVLLSASAGILALENIGGVPRTAILISILSSFGSVTSGLYFISSYQLRAPNSRESPDPTNALTIFNYNQYTLTHKGIALVLGLPMAFLVWSLVSFMVGILSFNFIGTETSGHISNVAYAVVSVAAVVFLLIALAFYTLSRLWGSENSYILFRTIRTRYMNFARHWRPLPTKSVA